MDAVKGKRGGARPNSGGARPGAGRPRKKSETDLIKELQELDKQIALRSRARVEPIQQDVAKDMKTVPTTNLDRPLSVVERQALLEERRAALAEIFPSGPDDPLEFLKAVQQNVLLNADLRIKSAMKLAEFMHAKPGEKGKKEQDLDEANAVGQKTRFGLGAAPKLVSNNG